MERVRKTAGKGSVKKEEKVDKRVELMEKMNEAALEAQEEYKEIPKSARTAIEAFFKTWYPKAGYKKLGKMIVGKPFITELD